MLLCCDPFNAQNHESGLPFAALSSQQIIVISDRDEQTSVKLNNNETFLSIYPVVPPVTCITAVTIQQDYWCNETAY